MSEIPSATVDFEDIPSSASGQEHYLPHPQHLGCYWCRKRGSGSEKLKKCAKCNVVLYCSRECQAASWPTHKPKCFAPIASERMNKLAKAYQKWVDVHQLSLNAIAGALIRSTGGVEFTLANGRSLVVTLLPKTDSWDDGDPAQWFSVVDARMCNKDENPYLDTRGKNLVDGQPQAQAEVAADIIPLRTDSEPTPELGILPVTYFIVNQGATFHHLHSIYPGDPKMLECMPALELGPLEEEFVADAYDDLTNMCIYCINNGIVFHEPKDQRKNKLPEVGSYAHASSGSWRWARMADGWVILNVVMKMPNSGMNKAEWTAESLWQMWGARLCY
ncbi:hypothetical protein V8D89_013785 [Ganoderma adspersum]